MLHLLGEILECWSKVEGYWESCRFLTGDIGPMGIASSNWEISGGEGLARMDRVEGYTFLEKGVILTRKLRTLM